MELSQQSALRQAARDLILSLVSRIEKLFRSLIVDDLSHTMSSEQLAEIVVKVAKAWRSESGQQMSVLLKGDNLEQLKKHFGSRLADALTNEVEIKINDTIKQGFRIAKQGDSYYFDISPDRVGEALYSCLSPSLRQMLTND